MDKIIFVDTETGKVVKAEMYSDLCEPTGEVMSAETFMPIEDEGAIDIAQSEWPEGVSWETK